MVYNEGDKKIICPKGGDKMRNSDIQIPVQMIIWSNLFI